MATEDAELLASMADDCQESADELLALVRKASAAVDELERRNELDWLSRRQEDLVACVSSMREIATKMMNGDELPLSTIVERQEELHEVLDSIRPTQPKAAAAAGTSSGDATTTKRGLHARLDQLDVGDSDEVDSDGAAGGDADERGDSRPSADDQAKYRAPKLVPMHFDENEEERRLKKADKARKRAMQSTLLQDLHAQHSEAPVEIIDRPSRSKVEAERVNFEENNYVRLAASKRERQLSRRRDNQSALDTLLKFGDYMAMDTVTEEGLKGNKRKSRGVRRSGGASKKKAKSGGKRRRT